MKQTMKLLAGLLCLTMLIGAVPLISAATERAPTAQEESRPETIGPLTPAEPAEPAYAGEYYDYPITPEKTPEVWDEAGSVENGGHQGLIDVCQIPEDVLEILTTEQLLKSCIHYPLSIDIKYFDTPMDGLEFETIFFNGIQELLKRKDFSETLTSYYTELTPEEVEEDGVLGSEGNFNKTLYTEALTGFAAKNELLEPEDCAVIALKRVGLQEAYATHGGGIVGEACDMTNAKLQAACEQKPFYENSSVLNSAQP